MLVHLLLPLDPMSLVWLLCGWACGPTLVIGGKISAQLVTEYAMGYERPKAAAGAAATAAAVNVAAALAASK
jgi:hypothetical protein